MKDAWIMKTTLLITLGALVSITASARTLAIAELGAKPDGTTDNTAVLQKAIDTCAAEGGGTVLVAGGTFMTYTLYPKSNVRIQIEAGATLKGGPDPLKYPEFEPSPFWKSERALRFNRRAMFYAVNQRNIAITGKGTIDGSSELFHHEVSPGNWKRNHDQQITGRNILFVGCKDVELSDILIYHPSGWSMWILDCDRVQIHKIKVETHRLFPNGDGIHLGSCRDVTISDCMIDSEDDALILRAYQEVLNEPKALERVVIANCILRSNRACAVRVGWTGDYEIRDCSLSNIIVPYARLGIQMWLPSWHSVQPDPVRGPLGPPPPPEASLKPFAIENLRFSNFTLVSPTESIRIEFPADAKVSRVKDLYFSDMKITAGAYPFIAVKPSDHVSDIHFSNVEFFLKRDASFEVKRFSETPWFKNVRNATFDRVRFIDEMQNQPHVSNP